MRPYINTGAPVVLSSKTIRLQATAHLSARYDRLRCKLGGFPGPGINRDSYIRVNLDASVRNIRDNALVPDGQGCYWGKPG